jgi:hypothetical protein
MADRKLFSFDGNNARSEHPAFMNPSPVKQCANVYLIPDGTLFMRGHVFRN